MNESGCGTGCMSLILIVVCYAFFTGACTQDHQITKQPQQVVQPQPEPEPPEPDLPLVEEAPVLTEPQRLAIQIDEARRKLEQWKAANPEPPIPQLVPHLFVDSSGQFSTKAKVAKFSSERITLSLNDGRSVTLAMDKLSDFDQTFLRESFGEYIQVKETWLAEYKSLEGDVSDALKMLSDREQEQTSAKRERIAEMDRQAAESEKRRKARIAAGQRAYERSKVQRNRTKLTPGENKYVDDDVYAEVFGFKTLHGLKTYWDEDPDPEPSVATMRGRGIVPIPKKTKVRIISKHEIAPGVYGYRVSANGNELFVGEMDLYDERDP